MSPLTPGLFSVLALGGMFAARFFQLRQGMDRRARRTWFKQAASFLVLAGIGSGLLAALRGLLILPWPLVMLSVCAGAYGLYRSIHLVGSSSRSTHARPAVQRD
jgi:hypothetical protein